MRIVFPNPRTRFGDGEGFDYREHSIVSPLTVSTSSPNETALEVPRGGYFGRKLIQWYPIKRLAIG